MPTETKSKPQASTRPLRVKLDTFEMVSAILWAEGHQTTAEGFDAAFREEIESRFKKLPRDIQKRANDRIAAIQSED